MTAANRLWVVVGMISINTNVNWIGVAVLVIGALIGFFAKWLAGKLWPAVAEQRTPILRLVGLGLAFLGTLIAMRFLG